MIFCVTLDEVYRSATVRRGERHVPRDEFESAWGGGGLGVWHTMR